MYHWATLPASTKCLYSELYQMMVLTSELALSCVTVHQPLCDQQHKILGNCYSHRILVHEVWLRICVNYVSFLNDFLLLFFTSWTQFSLPHLLVFSPSFFTIWLNGWYFRSLCGFFVCVWWEGNSCHNLYIWKVRKTSKSQFSSSVMWVPGIKLSCETWQQASLPTE